MPGDIEEKVSSNAAQVTRSAAQVERSATATQRAAVATQLSVDRNTQLAADRTVLAAERTYAAWVRTGLASLATGVGARALLAGTLPGWFGALTGSGLILFSTFCFIAAVWREIWFGVPPPPADIKRLPILLLVIINGFLILISLAALLGVWLIRA
jgi:putative membrane protein